MKMNGTGVVIDRWIDKSRWAVVAAVRLEPTPDHTDGKVVVFRSDISTFASLALITSGDRVEINCETTMETNSNKRYATNEVKLEGLTVVGFAKRSL